MQKKIPKDVKTQFEIFSRVRTALYNSTLRSSGVLHVLLLYCTCFTITTSVSTRGLSTKRGGPSDETIKTEVRVIADMAR